MATGSSRLTRSWLTRLWYGPPGPLRLALLPLSLMVRAGGSLRRLAFARGWLETRTATVPVVVVGNIAVGGTGKTPVVAALASRARALGLRPGIVSRGYGGERHRTPVRVQHDSDPVKMGDEPVMLARETGAPVVVCVDRAAAVEALATAGECDLVLSDDGLQHYAMARAAEIIVVDGVRGFGNGALLPAGPLRETQARIAEVDQVLYNGGERASFRLVVRDLAAPDGTVSPASTLAGQVVDAIAGIGHPERFFATLESLGCIVNRHPFDDHHHFVQSDLAPFGERPLLMTTKDAVKCAALTLPASSRTLRVNVEFEPEVAQALDALLERVVRMRPGIRAAPNQ